MKVLFINGSFKVKGCIYIVLLEIVKELEKENIEIEIFYVGNKLICGCMVCGGCLKIDGKCVFNDDIVNIVLEKVKEVDGFIFGLLVYYVSVFGVIILFLDRFFYVGNFF